MMKATFTGNPEINPGGRSKLTRKVTLPFRLVTARAIIVRRGDGALLGCLHRPDGRFAPPGGLVEDGETPEEALLRELAEENIQLVAPDDGWQERLVVDYYPGYRSLDLWYLFVVEAAEFGENEEIIRTRWIPQSEDLWYPGMREKFILALKRYAPEVLQVDLVVV